MAYSHKLTESKYHNWVKAGLAVLFTKEGIQPFVHDEIEQFQRKCLADICNNNKLLVGSTCNSCCTENILVCPTNKICNVRRGNCSFHRNTSMQYNPAGCLNNICHNFKTKIEKAHRYNSPSYRNTDATQWCSNPWEVAKCFLPPNGYMDVTSADEMDFNGVISVIMNYKGFQSKVQDINIFDKGRDIGKAFRHSPTLEMEDTDLQQYFTDLQNLLSDPGYLTTCAYAQNARQKLSQLLNDTLVIGKDDVRKVLHHVAKAVQDRIRTEVDAYKQEAEKQNLKLIKTTNSAINAIKGQENVSMSELNAALKSALGEIKKQTKESVEMIKMKSAERLQTISTEGDVAVKKVKNAIEVGTEEGVQKVKKEADAGVKTIASKIDDGLLQIDWKLKTGNEQCEDVKYNKLKKDLQSDLMTYYKDICGTISICPCLEEVDAPFIKVYIPPYPLYSQETDKLKQLSKQGKGQETEISEGIPVNSLQKIFNKELEECKYIYLTAEPGLGKTSFVKWLALNWCQAHSPVNNECCYFDQNDVKQMKTFEFLFIIFLRETDANERHVDSLITNNVITALARQSAYTPEVLEKVMFNEKCLIILDGLDEWAMSGIPKRSTRNSCTYLTTSRPWRFCVLPLNSTKIDQHVCIEKVEQVCSKKLIPRILSIIEERECLRKDVLGADNACQIFKSMLKEKHITQFYNTPVILLQLLYLWNISKEIGNSQREIYADVVDTLFSIAEKKVQLLGKFKYHRISNITYIKTSFFEAYYDLIIKLGKLAFETLFSENKESSLVFDEAVAFKYLPGDENATTHDVLSTCLQTGLLTKQSVYVRARRKQYTYSFYHKTVQEFFTALYIQSEYSEYILDVIKKRCSSVSCILEMRTVFMFLSSFNPIIASVILQSLQSTINEDEKTDMYRRRYFHSFDEEYRQMKSIQDMLVSCVTESEKNGHGDQYLPLMDIIFDHSCEKESYSASLKNLLQSNSKKIQSLAVSSFLKSTPDVLNYVRKHFELSEVWSVCKLQIDESSISNDLHDLIARSAKTIKSVAVLIDSKSAFVPGITDQFLGLKTKKLESLYLSLDRSVKQNTLEQLIHFVSHQTILKEVNLATECSVNIYTNCSVPPLHLCQHEHLQKLSLKNVPLQHLQLNDHLQELTVKNVPLTQLQLNDDLHELTLKNVPLTHLQLNDHLQELTMKNVPLTQLQLNDDLHELTLKNVPLTHLQMNDHLQELTLQNVPLTHLHLSDLLQDLILHHVPLTHLQLNDHLQELTLNNEPLTHLQLNDHLEQLMLENLQLTHLQLNGHLQELTLKNVPLTHLQLNDHLKQVILYDIPLTQLQLDDHLQKLSLRKVSLTHLQLNAQLKQLTLNDVPLTQLQLGDNILKLRLDNVPLTHLQLNDHLKQLTLDDVPLTHLQLGDNILKLRLDNIPLTHLQLNDHLKQLTLDDVPLTQLQLGDNLPMLTLKKVPLTHLQLNGHLKQLTLDGVPLIQLQLDNHLHELTLWNVPLTHLQLNDILQELTLYDVPLTQLHLGYNLQELTLDNIPLTHLQLNDRLKHLTLKNILLKHLQLNGHLQELTLHHVPLTHLQLNDHLNQLTLDDIPLTQLQLGDNLRKLTLDNIPLTHLQLNDHLRKLILKNVPLTHLQLNDHLQKVTLKNLPLEQLQLNDHLQKTTLKTVPLTHLQLNDLLHELTLHHVPLTHLQLNDHLNQLTLDDVPLTQLQLGVTLQKLSLDNVPLTHLQLNDHLQEFTLDDVPLAQLQLGDNLQELTLQNVPLTNLELNISHIRNIHLISISLSSSTFNIFLDKVINCEQDVSLKLDDITLKDINNTEHQETVRINISQFKDQGFTSATKSLELYSFNVTSKVLQTIVDTVLNSEHHVTVSLSDVTVEDVTSTGQQDILNQDNTSVLALRGHSFTQGEKAFQLRDVTISYGTFKQFVNTVQKCRYPVTIGLCACFYDEELYTWFGDESLNCREEIEYVRSLSSFTIVVDDEDCFSFTKTN
ncbi:uncharacterized protein LOC128548526 [Mercenaria mercenaria]|uniref:uncharacterized protein LOC128548526 n=1 Tax=Mercenaria mercenaria TaxID=6596 RepID=UPI00234E3857|nr:uncharacterized protein LOC128548526 [Mercenaria mercenaria]